MLFLKQIRAQGFKSFAELTVLDFTNEMVGIVGPNGSGKSNITDAIRWALGEQSAKSLRGGGLDDVVFSGSANLAPQEVAEVTLVFNNDNKLLTKWTTPIVEVTRRFNKKTRDSDFYINGDRVKLRDIQDLAMETGLTKSSIAIISQGTISKFAEAKPDERREIFDEAAGVAKYKRRKREAQTKLIKAIENGNRAKDLTNEIAKRLPNLERQARKAKIAREKRAELQQFEVAILSMDVQTHQKRISEIMAILPDLESEQRRLTADLSIAENELNELLHDNSLSVDSINELNQNFQKAVNQLGDLKVQKSLAEERENKQNKYQDANSAQAKQVQSSFFNIKASQQVLADKVKENFANLQRLNEQYDLTNGEYQNARQTLERLQKDENILNYKLGELRQRQARGFTNLQGYEAVINNKKNLPGVIGTLRDLVTVDEEYQIAISAVIANTLNAVVMERNQDVKGAINYLKNNRLGRATFLPIDTLTPSTINGSIADVIGQQNGFLGFANQIVKIKPQYQVALDYALGTVIVVRQYDDALAMAKTIQNRFNIVSLGGERILPRGAIIGGTSKVNNIFKTINATQSSAETLETELFKVRQTIDNSEKIMSQTKINRDKIRDDINDLQGQINIGNHQIQQTDRQLEDLNHQFVALCGQSLMGNNNQNSNKVLQSAILAKDIAKLEQKRDEIQNQINKITLAKNKYAERQQELNRQNQSQRVVLAEKTQELNDLRQELALIEKDNSAKLDKLRADYGLTLETILEQPVEAIANETEARARIETLIQDLRNLGNVNDDAIEEYEAEKERFDYFQTELENLYQGIRNIEAIIENIDKEMSTQFRQVVDDVNLALPEVFQRLFGGGEAHLRYTDPENILETGIDIQVNPPGKKITNINLLSGGEKSLVALSVLFSILKVRPLPLVILDEAEAPLDPANVERFARYVRHFTDVTQFLIVTHREGTMENCDVLYGVTMETQGVTKMVRIKLVEAKNLAQNPIPTAVV